MVNESFQLEPGDAILGGENPEPPIDAEVLEGIEGAKQQCADPDVKIRIDGLREAVKYGEAGIELLVNGLKDESPEVGLTAYSLLQENVEPELKIALKIYDTYQPRCVNLLGHSHPIQGTSLSSNGLVLASYSQVFANGCFKNAVKLWNVKTGSLKTTINHDSAIHIQSIALNPNLQNLAIGCFYAQRIELWDLETGAIETTLSPNGSIAFSLDGKFIAAGGSCHTNAWIWGVKTGNLQTTISIQNDVVALSPNGSLMASVASNQEADETLFRSGHIQLWYTIAGKLKTTLRTCLHHINQIVFSPNGEFLAVSCSSFSEFQVLNIETGTIHRCYTGTPTGILTFSLDGQSIAAASRGKIEIWDVKTGTQKISFCGYPRNISSLAFSPDGNIVASSSVGNIVQVWRLELSNLNRFDPMALFHSYLEIKQSNSNLYGAIQAIASGTTAEQEAAFLQLQSRQEFAIQAILYSYINAQPLSQFEVNKSRQFPEWNISTYKWLKYFLATNQLQKAEEETNRILLQEVGGTDINAIDNTLKIPVLSAICNLCKAYTKIDIPVDFIRNLEMKIEYLNGKQEREREEKWNSENLGFGAHLRDS
ncbi:hypothetical protein QT971_10090 [Microcoleus sp. herbarium19]|uniref:WD40 repeat domain-containing protein n=1 Tax=unclassified Microcoleus TaxID=2642155 RepID=UPI002FD020CD